MLAGLGGEGLRNPGPSGGAETSAAAAGIEAVLGAGASGTLPSVEALREPRPGPWVNRFSRAFLARRFLNHTWGDSGAGEEASKEGQCAFEASGGGCEAALRWSGSRPRSPQAQLEAPGVFKRPQRRPEEGGSGQPWSFRSSSARKGVCQRGSLGSQRP